MKRSLTCVGPQRHRRRSSLTSLTRRPIPARKLGSAMSGNGMEFLFLCSICSIVTIYRGNIGFKWDVPSSIWFVQMLGEEAYLEQRRGFSNIALLQYNCYSSGLLLFSRIHRIIKIWRQMWTYLAHLNIRSEEVQVSDPQSWCGCLLQVQEDWRASWEPATAPRPGPHFMSGVRYWNWLST